MLQPLKILIKDILAESEPNLFTVSNIINQNDIFKSLNDDRFRNLSKELQK